MQKHTDALVLAYLLQPDNAVELLSARVTSNFSYAEHLLHEIDSMSPSIRAQILGLDNRQVAEKWLSISKTELLKAAVFFNDDEELLVLDQGCVELLQVSYLARQLGDCLIYLDEVHTGGTDLELPRNYRNSG
jgi:hypothetical protein